MKNQILTLSKTDYILSQKCVKALWLKKHKKNIGSPLTSSALININEGNFVGELATRHPLFKGGVLVKTLHNSLAKETTDALLRKNTNFIYEAYFEYIYQDLRCIVRVDILEKNEDGSFNIIEVKSASKTKVTHYMDIAFQKWVIEKAGHKVKNSKLMKVNSSYKLGNNSKLDLPNYFTIEDVNVAVKDYVKPITKNVKDISKVIHAKVETKSSTGTKCKTPFVCPFSSYCNKDLNIDSVKNLSRLSKGKRTSLEKNKIKYIKDIPLDFPLTERQTIQRKVAVTGMNFVKRSNIETKIDSLVYPLYHLDFETYNTSIPKIKNTSPNQFITFQASLHKEYKSGKLMHSEFLHTNKTDPRLKLINFLISSLGKRGSIVVYNVSFERTRLKEMRRDFPQFTKEITNMINRLWDLEDFFKKTWYYDHNFKGRSSIKYVLPVISPDLGYDRMDIQNGSEAQATYQELIAGKYKGGAFHKVKKSLLSYCELDTYAMVVILRYLKNGLAYGFSNEDINVIKRKESSIAE